MLILFSMFPISMKKKKEEKGRAEVQEIEYQPSYPHIFLHVVIISLVTSTSSYCQSINIFPTPDDESLGLAYCNSSTIKSAD